MADEQPILARVRVPSRVDFAGGWSDVRHFSEREGGAVVNAAIDRAVEGSVSWGRRGLRLHYSLDVPPDSHLGTSASSNIAWIALTAALMRAPRPPVELAEFAYQVEHLFGEEGGKQDGYAAALGGFNLLRFGKADQPAEVERLAVPDAAIQALEQRSVLCYTGAGRSSSAIHKEVWRRYGEGDEGVAAALRQLRDSAFAARAALLAGDLDALGGVLTLNREATRQLHPELIPPDQDALFAAATQAGAAGGKACGAGGGGGFVYVIAHTGRREAVARALRRRGGTIYPFHFVRGAPLLGWPEGGNG